MSDVSRRICANGAARGDLGACVDLLDSGAFASPAEALAFIAESQPVSSEVFELVLSTWELLND